MYVNGTAGVQDNSAPPIATAPRQWMARSRTMAAHAGAH